MSNKTVTDCSVNRSVGMDDAIYEDDVYTAAGAGTTLAGTILARDSVSGKLVVFEKGGSTNENGIAKAVLPEDVVATGAGDIVVRPLVKGTVLLSRLVIDADGDNSNVDAAVKDGLRNYGITVRADRDASELEA